MRGIAKIRRMEAELGWPELPSAIAVAELAARQSIRADIGSKQFSHFIRTTKARDGQQWAIAVLSSEGARKMELRDEGGVVRLTSGSVDNEDHQARWSAWQGDEWNNVQRLVDHGRWLVPKEYPKRREVWGDINGDGKCWKLVFKETIKGELILMTFHRLRSRQVKRLERKKEKGG